MDKKALEELINNINDKIFKSTFQQKESVVEYLKTFLATIAEMLDLDNLTLKDTNFISEELEEYFSDVIFETTLKDKKVKNNIRVILLFEHKKGIDSYFDLFLQLLFYIALIWKQDRNEKRSPTVVIPLVINQSKRRIKQKTLHQSLSGIPEELLKYIPQFEYHVLNVLPLDNEPIREEILNLNSNNILRSLFLAYIAIDQKNKLENILIEIFKFYKESPHQKDYFHQLFVFLMNEGYFSSSEIKGLLKEYLSEKEQKDMITTAQVWKQEGVQQGMQQGMQQGQYSNSRIVTLRGIFRKQSPVLLSELTGLTLDEVNTLAKSFGVVEKAWKQETTDIKALMVASNLAQNEVQCILDSLESTN